MMLRDQYKDVTILTFNNKFYVGKWKKSCGVKTSKLDPEITAISAELDLPFYYADQRSTDQNQWVLGSSSL